MPLREYECPDGHRFERLEQMEESGPVSCPRCGRDAERLISIPGRPRGGDTPMHHRGEA